MSLSLSGNLRKRRRRVLPTGKIPNPAKRSGNSDLLHFVPNFPVVSKGIFEPSDPPAVAFADGMDFHRARANRLSENGIRIGNRKDHADRRTTG
jgi:hypothetical protein